MALVRRVFENRIYTYMYKRIREIERERIGEREGEGEDGRETGWERMGDRYGKRERTGEREKEKGREGEGAIFKKLRNGEILCSEQNVGI
jgi:hypothetical protein